MLMVDTRGKVNNELLCVVTVFSVGLEFRRAAVEMEVTFSGFDTIFFSPPFDIVLVNSWNNVELSIYRKSSIIWHGTVSWLFVNVHKFAAPFSPANPTPLVTCLISTCLRWVYVLSSKIMGTAGRPFRALNRG